MTETLFSSATVGSDIDALFHHYPNVQAYMLRCQADGVTYEGMQINRYGYTLKIPAWEIEAIRKEYTLRHVARVHRNQSLFLDLFEGERFALAMHRNSGTELYSTCSIYGRGLLDPKLVARLESCLVKEPEQRIVPVTSIHILARTTMGGYAIEDAGEERQHFLAENYDEKAAGSFKNLVKQLVHRTPSGRLLLLSGEPGTGKTRYVRALLAATKDKVKVILVPSHLISDLSGPDLIKPLLSNHGPFLFVLEDADFALLSRQDASQFEREGNTRALSALLNMTDGILGSVLDIRAICTTNAKVESIDPALSRPGRLLDQLHFDRLPLRRCVEIVLREAKGEDHTSVWSGLTTLYKDRDDHERFATLAECYEFARLCKESRPKPRRSPPVRRFVPKNVPVEEQEITSLCASNEAAPSLLL